MGLGKSVVSVMMIIIIITTIKMAPFNYPPTTPTIHTRPRPTYPTNTTNQPTQPNQPRHRSVPILHSIHLPTLSIHHRQRQKVCVCGPVSLVYIYRNGLERQVFCSDDYALVGKTGWMGERVVWKCGSDMVDNLFFFFSFLVGCWGG